MFVLLCIAVFIVSVIGSAIFKMTYTPAAMKKYSVAWSDQMGTVHKDIPYGEGEANKFDLYLPADSDKESYGLTQSPARVPLSGAGRG